jgi:hypothetical protein
MADRVNKALGSLELNDRKYVNRLPYNVVETLAQADILVVVATFQWNIRTADVHSLRNLREVCDEMVVGASEATEVAGRMFEELPGGVRVIGADGKKEYVGGRVVQWTGTLATRVNALLKELAPPDTSKSVFVLHLAHGRVDPGLYERDIAFRGTTVVIKEGFEFGSFLQHTEMCPGDWEKTAECLSEFKQAYDRRYAVGL